MQNRITLVFTSDHPTDPSKFIYDTRSFTLLNDADATRIIDERINGNEEIHDLFEAIEEEYGTLDIGGSGDDFLWGFQTTGETEPKDFDTITQKVRDFFENEMNATLSPTTQTVGEEDPY